MDEVILMVILLSFGVLSLVIYVIVFKVLKNKRFQKINEQGREIIRAEKELDRSEAMKRGLHLYTDKRRKVK
jgi:hypothetical protein